MKSKVFFVIVVSTVLFLLFTRADEVRDVKIREMVQAIYENDYVAIETLLKDGMSPNDKSGRTSFIHLAVAANKIDVVKLFIKHKANLKAEGTEDLVSTAVSNRNVEMVELLVDNGAYINKPPFAGILWRPPLIDAVMLGDLELVKYLIAKGADVNAIDGLSLRTALQWASADGYIEIMQLLKNEGANIANRDLEGCTALMLAAQRGRDQAVKILLEWGASINERDNDGRTALMHACENGYLSTVELLLSRGADASIKGRGENNARSYAWAYLINKLLKEIDKSELEKCKNNDEVKEVLIRSIKKEDETLLIKCSGNESGAGLNYK